MPRQRLLILISISLLVGTSSIIWKNFLTQTRSSTFSLPTTTMTEKRAIVVGSGLAGLSASSQLIAHGINVHLLERAAKPGGNSMKASSGINGAPTRYQPATLGTDTSFYEDTIKSAGSVVEIKRKEREGLMNTLTSESAGAVNWLVDEMGVDLSVVAQLGGHSFPRTHRGAGKTPPGVAIITALLKSLQASPLFKFETNSIVTKVLKSENGVEGVEYENAGEVKALKGVVIFASGGFAGDAHGMLAQYRPDLSGFPSTNDPKPGSQHLLTEVGAQLLDMEQVQVHPTSFIDPKDPGNPAKFLAAEILRGEGGILLSGGKRFVNEMETRKVITEKIMELKGNDEGGVRQWDVQLVLDEGAYQASKNHMDFYLWKGLMHKTTISELTSPSASLSTIRHYASASSAAVPDIFGRTSLGNWKLKPEDANPETTIYVGRVTPAVHFTMGGAMINEHSEVLDADGKGIEYLWAAGEVTGGVHGENRLGGSSLLECVVFGRRAGDSAANAILRDEDRGQ